MEKPPSKSTAREIVEKGVEGAVGAIPVTGSPLAAAFPLAIGYAYNRRMQAWFDEVAQAIADLQEETGCSLDDLVEDDSFLDAVAVRHPSSPGDQPAGEAQPLGRMRASTQPCVISVC